MVLPPFYSRHYAQTPVTFCDIFQISKQIVCFQSTESNLTVPVYNSSELLSACDCSIHHTVKKGTNETCEKSWLSQPALYGFPLYAFPCRPNFSYKDGLCTAGYIRQNHINQPSPPVVFTSKYVTLGKVAFDDIVQNYTAVNLLCKPPIISVRNNSSRLLSTESFIPQTTRLIVAHWRREDQLEQRCHQMPSPYCKGSKEFLLETKKKISVLLNRTFLSKHKFVDELNCGSEYRYVVYVATNEKNPILLNDLKQAGLVLYSDLQVSNMKLKHEDPFVIELILACQYALSVFSSGYSNFNPFIEQCRHKQKGHFKLF